MLSPINCRLKVSLLDKYTFDKQYKTRRPFELQHIFDILRSYSDADEDSRLLGCLAWFTVTEISEALASYIFSVKEVQNIRHMPQNSAIFQLSQP